jgi:hypothetical protein
MRTHPFPPLVVSFPRALADAPGAKGTMCLCEPLGSQLEKVKINTNRMHADSPATEKPMILMVARALR